MVPGGAANHNEIKADNALKKMKDWFKAGKPKDKFDPTWMGLIMLTQPTYHFGWEGLTATMKKVSNLKFFLILDHCGDMN